MKGADVQQSLDQLVFSLHVFGTAILVTGFATIFVLIGAMCFGKLQQQLAFSWTVTVLAITVAGFLAVAGYSAAQLVPIIGLLSTVIGYVLGQAAGRSRGPEEPAKPAAPPAP